jgi:hypothetical protein
LKNIIGALWALWAFDLGFGFGCYVLNI